VELLPQDAISSFSLVSHAEIDALDGGLHLQSVLADAAVPLSDEVVFVRPDGYVAAACKHEQATETWRRLKTAASLVDA
jgi:hypothetical protein